MMVFPLPRDHEPPHTPTCWRPEPIDGGEKEDAFIEVRITRVQPHNPRETYFGVRTGGEKEGNGVQFNDAQVIDPFEGFES
jgi:hypothetical protein